MKDFQENETIVLEQRAKWETTLEATILYLVYIAVKLRLAIFREKKSRYICVTSK